MHIGCLAATVVLLSGCGGSAPLDVSRTPPPRLSQAELERLVQTRLDGAVRELRGVAPERFRGIARERITAGRPLARLAMAGQARPDPWRAIVARPVDYVVPVLVDGRPAAEFTIDAFTRARVELAVGTAGSPASEYEAVLRLKARVRQAFTGDAQVRLVSDGVWTAAVGWTPSRQFAAAFMPPGMGMVDEPLSDRQQLLMSIEGMRVYHGSEAIDLVNAVFLESG
jgi:hypothetical protein